MREIEPLIIKYLNGEISEKDLLYLQEWLMEAGRSGNERDLKQFKDYAISNHLSELRTKKFNFNKAYKKFERSVRPVRSFNYSKILRYAAVILIGFSLVYLIKNSRSPKQLTLVSVQKGDKENVILSDGSTVVLNSGSTLKYPASFTGDQRRVLLLGEAFFTVVKDEKKPFIVDLPSGLQIKVLGTTFNVKAYKEDNIVKTTLLTGKILLSVQDKETLQSTLLPGEQALFSNSDHQLKITTVDDPQSALVWQQDILIFKNESLHDIVNDLSRHFNCEIIIKDKKLEKLHITASFTKNTSLDTILEFLGISGNFTKRKVSENKWEILTKTDDLPMK